MADSVKIRIDGDTKGFKKALGSIEGATKKTIGAVVKGTGIIAAGFGAATVASLNFAGELEQNLGGSEAVFKEYASEIQGAAEKAFKNMGLSTSDYLATANKMGALFKGSGFEMAEAADITQKAMQRAADVASIMGIDVSMAMESIAGAAKGNLTMMDNLGVAMNDTTLNAYALEIGLGKTTAQMTNQEKVALAMEMFLDRTAYATGNYAKENDTLAGSLNTAKAALENFMSGAGTVDEVVESLTNAGDVILENLTTLVPKLAEGAGELVKGLMPSLIEMIVDNAPQLIEAGLEIISAFIQAIEDNSSEIARAALVIGQTLLEGLIRIIPQIAEVAGQIIAEFARELGKANPLLKPLAGVIELLANNIGSLITAIITFVTVTKTMVILQSVAKWFTTAKTAIITAKTAITTFATATSMLTTKTRAQIVATQALTVAKKALAPVVGIVAAGIAALVVGMNDGSSATDNAADSIENLAKSQMTEANEAVYLKDRLFELEEQINSGKLSDDEATKAKNEFCIVAERLEDIIPGISQKIMDETGAINLQKTAIENLTGAYYELCYTQSLINAYQGKLDEIAKKIVEEKSKADNLLEVSPALQFVKNKFGEDEFYKTYSDASEAKEEYDKLFKEFQELKNKAVELTNSLKIPIKEDEEEEEEEGSGGGGDGVPGFTNMLKRELEKQKTAIELALEYELYTLERANKLGIITEKEYYDGLQKIRDKYFAEGSEDWQEYTEDIEDYYDSVFKDIKAKVDKLADNFVDKTNKTYATITLDADGEIQTWHTLSDMDSQNKQLKDYLSLLEQLKEKRGEIPKEAIEDLSGMDPKEAITFLETMLNASDDQWNNWVKGIEENKALAKELSKEIYADEIEENQKIIQKLVDEWGEVPDNFFTIGEACGDEYGEGFKAALSEAGTKLKDAAMGLFSTFSTSLSLQLVNSADNGKGTVSNYTDNRTTNITAASSSPHAIIEAQKQAGIYQEHTSKFGG